MHKIKTENIENIAVLHFAYLQNLKLSNILWNENPSCFVALCSLLMEEDLQRPCPPFFFLPGLCTTQDVDIFIRHMNNARYIRELDFARFHYYGLTGLYEEVRKSKGGAVQGASSVRYRKTIPIFSAYKITTKVKLKRDLSWDLTNLQPDLLFHSIHLLYPFAAHLVGREGHLFGTTIRHAVRWICARHRTLQTVHHQRQCG